MPRCLSQRQPTLRPSTQVVTPGTSPGTPRPTPQQYSTYFPSIYPGNYPRYLSRYSPSTYPDYCLGWLVAMLPQTAALLFSQVDSAPAVHIDDVYITGILRQDTNVSLSMLSTNPLFHTSLFSDVLSHCRFLSWATHVFAYDLAYEPDGWPWRPIEFFVEHIQELALSEISDSDPNSVSCLHSFLLQHLFFAIILLNFIILFFNFTFLHWLKH